MKPKTKLDRYLMAALGAKTIYPQENPMNTYFVDYSFLRTGVNFSQQYGFATVQANSKEEAIRKVRKTAPKNAKGFRATQR